MFKTLLVLSSLLITTHVYAVTLKFGVLAPEGTNWAKQMKKMAKAVKKATDGNVKFKIYFGGSQGDEHDVLRKIRVGQLHGGMFTGKTLGDINGDVRVVELPFTFYNDREKAWATTQKLAPFFDKGFKKNEFENLGFSELGLVYFVSQKDTPSIESLNGVKIWSWEGDKLVSAMIEEMKLVSIPLPLPDVLSSLSTGIIEAAYAPPLGIIALQWNTKIKYLVDFPIAYSVGAFLVSNKGWNKVPAAHRETVKKIANKYIAKVSKANIADNIAALESMKALGVKFTKFPDSDVQKGKALREKIVGKLKGKLFSEEAYKLLNKNL